VKRLLLVAALTVASVTALASPAGAIPPPVLTGVATAGVGGDHSCVVTTGSQIVCWGSNWDGEIGNGSWNQEESGPRYVLAPTGSGRLGGVTQVAAGSYMTCARLSNGQARCWGYNGDGEVGNGSLQDRQLRAKVVSNPAGNGPLTGVTQLTAGERHVCALLSNGQVRCWGSNVYGQLGAGPVGELSLRPRVVRTPSGPGALTGVTQIDAGHSHTCARLSNGQARCWGLNDRNVLGGNPATEAVARPIVVRRGNGQPLLGVSQIAAGRYNTCVRYSNGRVGCWGDGTDGANGNGSQSDQDHAVYVKDAATQVALTGVTEVDVADIGGCARRTNGDVVCWGYGTLVGDGSGSSSTFARRVRNHTDTGFLANVSDLSLGRAHACVATTGRRAFCWGENSNEQVGPNDTPFYPVPEPAYAPPPPE
jgi:alpha-tubulin suppressor-like RCC1 family protein